MSDPKQTHLFKGILAGMAGGLAASWVMNVFMEGPGQKLQQSVAKYSGESAQQPQPKQDDAPKEDATMKAVDAIALPGGRRLSHQEKVQGGPIVHYTFGALTGGLYGGLAEYSSQVRAGFGTAFGGVLFSGADLIAVPGFHLSPPLSEQPKSALATPFAAHIVYGVTTELIRRLLRAIL